MIYTYRNCAHGTVVVHVPTAQTINDVMSVDTVRKTTEVIAHPIRADEKGDVITRTEHYSRIKVVYDAQGLACLFLLDPVDDPDAEVTAADKNSEVYA